MVQRNTKESDRNCKSYGTIELSFKIGCRSSSTKVDDRFFSNFLS